MEDSTIFVALGLSSFFAFSLEEFLKNSSRRAIEKTAFFLVPAIILCTIFIENLPIALGSSLNYVLIYFFIKFVRKCHEIDQLKKHKPRRIKHPKN